MPDYSQAKMYRVVADNTPRCYVGSTCGTLAARMGQHRRNARVDGGCSSKLIVLLPGSRIELIELWPCTSSAELHVREGYHQAAAGEMAVNSNRAGRTQTEYSALYRAANRGAIAARDAEYRAATRVARLAQKAAYRATHRAEINAKQNAKRAAKLAAQQPPATEEPQAVALVAPAP